MKSGNLLWDFILDETTFLNGLYLDNPEMTTNIKKFGQSYLSFLIFLVGLSCF
jgi:hypothetical protein